MNNPKNSPKSNPTKPAQEFRETLEKGASQARATNEEIGAATTAGTDVLKSNYSTAISGIQDYNSKLLEFAHANAKAAFEFLQQLSGAKSPEAFVELSTEHARKQFEILTEQTKQLTSLAQSATLAAVEPIKTGLGKAFNHAA
jgi:phasin